jgi:glycosyltransferase involved in cell wall biosynthesis
MTDYVPRISVIVPLYNKEEYVKRAIDSVLAQRYIDFELIVINDGSTDNGPKIVKQIKDHRLRIIDQLNSGVSAARNRGIREAKSELIAFLDADDEWLPDFLETVVRLADRFPDARAFITGYLLLKGDEHGYRNISIGGENEKYGCYFDLICKGVDICSSSSIAVRRSVFDRAGTFRVGYKLGEDLDMWFRIGLHYKFVCSPKICALYHYYQPNHSCRFSASKRVSPLYISLLKFEKDSHINPVVKSKAIKYLSSQLKRDIEYVFFNGFREIAMLRLHLYRKKFGVDFLYIKLHVLNKVPPLLLNVVSITKLMLVQYILKLKSVVHKGKCIMHG